MRAAASNRSRVGRGGEPDGPASGSYCVLLRASGITTKPGSLPSCFILGALLSSIAEAGVSTNGVASLNIA
jgi:hypothetical protein